MTSKLLLPIRHDKGVPPTEIVYILEDSPRLSDDQYNSGLCAIEEAVNKCTLPNPKHALLIYNNINNQISGLVEQKTDLVSDAKKFVRKRDGANLYLSLLRAKELFVAGGVNRMLYLLGASPVLTAPPHPLVSEKVRLMYPDVMSLVTDLKQMQVDIIGIALGENPTIQSYCSLNKYFPLSNFSEVAKTVFEKSLKMEERKIHDYDILMKVKAVDIPICLGEDLTLELTINNNGREDIPPGLEIRILPSEYFNATNLFFKEKDKIDQGGTITRKVTLIATGETRPILIPDILEIVINLPKREIHCNLNAVRLTSEIFIKSIITGTSTPPIPKIPFFNILCFGVAGAGKSAFINSLLTSLNDKITPAAAVGGAGDHVTRDLTRFCVSQIKNLHNVPVRFFDIWGVDQDNYRGNMFLDVLQGRLPDGYAMKDRISHVEAMKDEHWESYERRIHGVLFFMPFSVADNPEMVAALKIHLTSCIGKNRMNPILIITRASNAGGPQEQEEVRLSLAEKFNLPPASLYMFDNYTCEVEKSMALDKRTLDILVTMLKDCDTYQTFNRQALEKEVPTVIPNQHPQSGQQTQGGQQPQQQQPLSYSGGPHDYSPQSGQPPYYSQGGHPPQLGSYPGYPGYPPPGPYYPQQPGYPGYPPPGPYYQPGYPGYPPPGPYYQPSYPGYPPPGPYYQPGYPGGPGGPYPGGGPGYSSGPGGPGGPGDSQNGAV